MKIVKRKRRTFWLAKNWCAFHGNWCKTISENIKYLPCSPWRLTLTLRASSIIVSGMYRKSTALMMIIEKWHLEKCAVLGARQCEGSSLTISRGKGGQHPHKSVIISEHLPTCHHQTFPPHWKSRSWPERISGCPWKKTHPVFPFSSHLNFV